MDAFGADKARNDCEVRDLLLLYNRFKLQLEIVWFLKEFNIMAIRVIDLLQVAVYDTVMLNSDEASCKFFHHSETV